MWEDDADDAAEERARQRDEVLDAIRDVMEDDAWELFSNDPDRLLSAESWRQLRGPLEALLDTVKQDHYRPHERAWRASILRAAAALRAVDDLWAELAVIEEACARLDALMRSDMSQALQHAPTFVDALKSVVKRTWSDDDANLRVRMSPVSAADPKDGLNQRWLKISEWLVKLQQSQHLVTAAGAGGASPSPSPLSNLSTEVGKLITRLDAGMRSRPDALRALTAEVEREAAALRMIRRVVARADVKPFSSVPAGAGGGARGPDDPTIPLERAGQDPVGVGLMIGLKVLRVGVLAAAFTVAQRAYVQAHASAVVGEGRPAPPPLSRVLMMGLGLDAFVQLLVLLVLIMARTLTAPPPKTKTKTKDDGGDVKKDEPDEDTVVRAAPVIDDAFLVAYLIEYCASTGLLLTLGLLLGAVMDRKRYFGMRDDAVVGSLAYRDILIGVGAAAACVPFHLIL